MTAGAFARHWHDLPPGTRLTVGENRAKRHIPYRRGCASSPYIRIVSVFRFEENFDEYEGDVNASATKLATFFHVDANAIGDGYVRVEEDPSNGNLYLKNHVFTQVYSKTGIRDPYEFAMTD